MAVTTAPAEADGALGLRERKKRAARAAIVEAALDLFSERGFDVATVADIAARAGVSPATVARYFPSKESLLFAEGDQRVPLLRQAIMDRPPDEGPLESVHKALHRQPWAEGDSQERLLRSRQAILRSTQLRGQAASVLATWRQGIAQALEDRGVPVAEAAVVAVVVAAVLDEASDRWATSGGREDLTELIEESLVALKRVCGSQQ